MNKENTKQTANETLSAIEDLTLNETASETVKGGAAIDYLLEIDGIKGESEPKKETPTQRPIIRY